LKPRKNNSERNCTYDSAIDPGVLTDFSWDVTGMSFLRFLRIH